MLPNPQLPFELISDSCGVDLGAVLMQLGRKAAFYSKETTGPERNYINHARELLAVIVAFKQFSCCLQGNHFVLVAVNKPNTFLGNTAYLPYYGDKLAGVNICNA